MKNTLLICSIIFATSFSTSISAKELIKSCSTTLTMPEETNTIETQIDVFKSDSLLEATISQNAVGQSSAYNDEAQLVELQVRVGLFPDINQEIENLNLAERLIVHALTLTEDPIFENSLNAGFDLRKVRTAKVYIIGKPTNMGLTAILEAKDEFGKNLGSFLGGFFVSACK